MIGFFTAHVHRELAKLRADRARLHTETCTLRAELRDVRSDNDWLLKMGRQVLADSRTLGAEVDELKSRQGFLLDENAAQARIISELSRNLAVLTGHPSGASVVPDHVPSEWNQ
jgi:uncharacterized protein (DUF3084 family)